MRISATSRSSSVCDTLGSDSFRVEHSRNGDDLVAAHDERPRLAGRTGDLCVDEHVLDLLRSTGEPIAGAPCSYLKAWQLRCDPPLAPPHLAVERDRRAFEPDVVVFAHGRETTAEVEAARARRGGEQALERRRLAVRETEQVAFRPRVQLAEAWKDLVANQAALGAGVRGVAAEREARGRAIRLGLAPPHPQQGTHDAVLQFGLDALGDAARDETVEQRLHLVR